MRPLRTLLVDDDHDNAQWLAAELERGLGPAVVAPDAYQALDRIRSERFDAVITEVALPGASGIDLLLRLEGDVAAVVLSWLASPMIIARALEAGAHAVLGKPCHPASLLPAVRAAVARARRTGSAGPLALV